MSTSTGSRRTYDDEMGGTVYGISVFAGVLLATLGGFAVLQGLSAVFNDEIFISTPDYVYKIDLTAWGWITIVLGLIGIAVGLGILKGQVWASSAGIGFAVLSALAQFAFLPYYPIWAMLIIAMDILVIWALCKQIARA